MAEEGFRRAQERDRYAPHVRLVNEMVDDLRGHDGRGWMPYVAPWHGGVDARVLSVLRDPGPATQDGTGSGFLCMENDDPTAARQCQAFGDAGIGAGDITPWNAYPWYINRAPTAAEQQAGVAPLKRLIELLPHLRVVLLQGGDAQRTWRRLAKKHPEVAQQTRFEVVSTYHPGRQALWSPDPAVRAAREQHRVDAYRLVAKALHERG
ncbi:uracil-DNA glycosylase [Streptomyces sp. ISL-36]|uniref:uracil-DNA glycosylase n=1 Tax=Streptomyces sp. ISL-36 TaxID=2819182 RepID=UPI001BE91A26|nr:uracil-DNA glycosylase [Streptomyces sp. ISL-36]MBT2441789.1 uracil-DNA glycosylase [Streptomyces sp. ISL-36]